MSKILNYFKSLKAACSAGCASLLIFLVRGYQIVLSPWLGGGCRFEPTCSHFALRALKSLPLKIAVWRVAKRLACCHPFHAGGFDPLEPVDERRESYGLLPPEGVSTLTRTSV